MKKKYLFIENYLLAFMLPIDSEEDKMLIYNFTSANILVNSSLI